MPRRLVASGVAAVAVAVLVLVRQAALDDLRAVEDAYVAGRKATACTIARLDPDASAEELERLEETLAQLVAAAASESRRVRDRFEDVDVGPFPRAGSSRAAVERALVAQVRLYAAMQADEDDAIVDDLVSGLGRRNRLAESELRGFRSMLLAPEPTGWDDRLNCTRADRRARAGDGRARGE